MVSPTPRSSSPAVACSLSCQGSGAWATQQLQTELQRGVWIHARPGAHGRVLMGSLVGLLVGLVYWNLWLVMLVGRLVGLFYLFVFSFYLLIAPLLFGVCCV